MFCMNVRIQENWSTLDVQEGLLLDQEVQRLTMLDRANEHLDQKTANLVQSGGILVSVIAAFNIVLSSKTLDSPIFYISMIAFFAFIGQLLAFLFISLPNEYLVPDTTQWHLFLDVPKEKSFAQVMSNYNEITDALLESNRKKVNVLRVSVLVIGIQVLCIALITGLRAGL